MILERLYLIRPQLAKKTADVDGWLENPPLLDWPIANHGEVRSAFQQLLTCNAQYRFLAVQGKSESGKSHITKQMLSNVLRMPDIACGRFDFKGSAEMDAEVKAFVQELGIKPPPFGTRLTEQLSHILEALKCNSKPTLLLFDTYEHVGESKSWVENQLLPSLIRAPWLRVVITGQVTPPVTGATWEKESHSLINLKIPSASEWFDYFKVHQEDLPFDDVKTVCKYTERAPLIVEMLGAKN